MKPRPSIKKYRFKNNISVFRHISDELDVHNIAACLSELGPTSRHNHHDDDGGDDEYDDHADGQDGDDVLEPMYYSAYSYVIRVGVQGDQETLLAGFIAEVEAQIHSAQQLVSATQSYLDAYDMLNS